MMISAPVCDPQAPRKTVNLSINSDLLRQARELGINLSKTLESQLEQILRQERARRWQEENREAIEAHNRFVENTVCSTISASVSDGAIRRHRNPGPETDEGFPYVLDIQPDVLDHPNLRVVVPLVRADVVDPPLPGLNPRFVVEESSVVMATTLIGGLPARSLHDPVSNLGSYRYDIIGAIDMLITGV